MKTIFRTFMFVATLTVGLITVIKIVNGCSWRDSVGILEELWKEIS